MKEHPYLVDICKQFLYAHGEEGEEMMEDAMHRMYVYLKRYYEPPPLGVVVEEKIETRDKMG